MTSPEAEALKGSLAEMLAEAVNDIETPRVE